MKTALIRIWRGRAFRAPLALWLGAALLAGGGCQKLGLEPENPAVSLQSADVKLAVGKNPFSVAIMRQAYVNVKKNKLTGLAPDIKAFNQSGAKPNTSSAVAVIKPETASDCLDCPAAIQAPNPGPDPGPVGPTHVYVRFKAANTDQLADLDDAGYRLSWEPMDESVAASTTVDFQSDDIAWIYTVVPEGTAFPAGIQREEIAALYLFNAEDGDAQDVDPWEPTPDPGPAECTTQYDPTCNCYLQCPLARGAAGTTGKKGKLSNQALATQKLKAAGVSPLALYNEAMRLSGHPDEALSDDLAPGTAGKLARPTATRYHPRGVIRVEDTDLGLVPLRGVKVESRRWFQFGSTLTDNQGGFYISTSYKSMAKLSLEFKNSLATTRGIISGIKFWQAVLPINAELGSYSTGSMENVAYNITYQGGLDKRGSKGASTWAAATLFNTLADEQLFSAARGLPAPPQGLNVWLFPDFPARGRGAGAAPMLRKMASTSIVSQAIDYLLVDWGLGYIALIKQIIQRQLPDLTVRYSGDQGALASHQLHPLFYHELGHAQHYGQVGNNFWTAYVSHIVAYGGYGGKSSSGSGRIAISEGWGNYVENLFMINKYQGTTFNFRAEAATDYLENQIPTDFNNGFNQGWFVYGMYHDMTDNTPEPTFTTVTDNVTVYTPVSVFRGLQSDVLSVREYQSKMNAQNGSLQGFELGQLVTSYRW